MFEYLPFSKVIVIGYNAFYIFKRFDMNKNKFVRIRKPEVKYLKKNHCTS